MSIRPLTLLALAAATQSVAMTDNPLLTESDLQFGYPRFDLIKVEHFKPAYEQGMAEELAEIERIAANPAAPTFENTIVALELAGETKARVNRIFSNLEGTITTPEMQALDKEMAPRLAAQLDAIRLNPKLFARIDALYQRRSDLGLDPESDRLLERYHQDFVRAGAKLDAPAQERLRAINAELASLQTTFSQNVLKETNASGILVDTREELAGLSDNAIAAAASAAKAAGHEGKFLIRLMNTSGQPPLDSLQNRALRQRISAASLARGSRGGEFDNTGVVARIARLRAERANLLGYPNHAAYQLEVATAKTVDAVNAMLGRLAPPAVANARREAAELQRLADATGGGFAVTAADWDFYSEQVRRERYAFDDAQLRPYFEMNRVLRDGVFHAATRLYGITFKDRPDLPRYHPDTQVFEVFNEDGSSLALFIVDWYARPSKRGGAWMNAYVSQSSLRGTRPVVANHLNIPKPPEGQPTLMTFDEVNTAFHEFGHALHGMFSAVRYPKFSGTAVPRDFVEFPSQVNEMWATWPEILANYARHYQTGEPLPAQLLAKVQAAQNFNQGFKTTEYLGASLLDQAWHQLAPDQVPAGDQAVAFEQAALRRVGMDFAPVPPRYRSTYFSHTFQGGYSAGYYSYIWAEVLDADTVDWIKANGGLTRANGDRLRDRLLSRGGSRDAMQLFRDLVGRDPDIAPLLKRRGLDAATGAAASAAGAN